MTNRTEVETRTLAQLSHEHERLDLWFAEIVERAATGDPRDCDAIWAAFVRQLENHMAFEESEVFPLYEQHEERLYDYYGRPAYWLGGKAVTKDLPNVSRLS